MVLVVAQGKAYCFEEVSGLLFIEFWFHMTGLIIIQQVPCRPPEMFMTMFSYIIVLSKSAENVIEPI